MIDSMSTSPVLVSAHRCGAGDHALDNTWPALTAALRSAAEFIEFDVQRCRDGVFVLFHESAVVVDGVVRPLASLDHEEFRAVVVAAPRYDEALRALASAGKKAHIDLKFTSPPEAYADPEMVFEVQATALAVSILGADNLIVTTSEDATVRAIRDWADAREAAVLVGLSLGGRSPRGRSPRALLGHVWSELFPDRRFLACGANLVVAQRHLARLRLARWARGRGLPLLVWTVNSDRGLRHWLQPGRAWLVTTDLPGPALATRSLAVPRPPGG